MSKELSEIESRFKRLIKQDCKPFPKKNEKLDAPHQKGVYIILNPKGKVLHVGRTPRAKGGIHQRLNDHLHGRSSFVSCYLKHKAYKLRRGYQYQYLKVKYPRRRALLEAYAIAHLCPRHLGVGKE